VSETPEIETLDFHGISIAEARLRFQASDRFDR
jgi:hypothetical protein